MSQPTGKEKASRIPLDYHRRADSLIRTRLQLAAAATVLALAYVAWGFFAPGGAAQHSHGPVAAVHATWETQCSACHRDFAPIRGDAAFAAWRWPGESLPWGHSSDANCITCHAGPAHVAREKPEEVASCASCHVEHQGRLASLTRMDDQHCTRCHASLADHVATANAAGTNSGRLRSRLAEKAAFANTITSWQADHPEFRSLKQDPGGIEFTHARHMSLGLRSAPDDRVQMKLADLAADDRERYRHPGQGDTDLVQLDCASCHQSDTSPLAGLAAASGEYMLPITYQQHCRACHPLTIDPQQPADLLPHGLPPDRIRRDLLGRLSQSLLEQAPQEWKELLRPVPIRQGEQPPREPLDLLTQRVLKAERHLQSLCSKCHEFKTSDVGPATLPTLIDPVQPSAVPQVWLRHARFDHAAHRFVDCRQCHARAYADHPQASESNGDVLIAGRETCLSCHSPPRGTIGGARHDCVECHRYHAADQCGTSLRDVNHLAERGATLTTDGRGEAP